MTLALLTPSYGPDFESFRLLHRSVLECTDGDVVHHAIVPDSDLPLFASIGSDRLRLTGLRSLLPKGFISTQWLARAAIRIPHVPRGARIAAIDRHAPWPPIRSWILQQIVKLEVAARSDANVLVLIDSDSQLIAPLTEERFLRDGRVPLFRTPGGITTDMTRHTAWHRNARRMLGLGDDGEPPFDDPIAGMVAWDPSLVRAALARVTEVGSRPWHETVGRAWEFSEYVLYGEFHRELAPRDRVAETDISGCVSWWDPRRLSPADVERLVAASTEDDVVLHIQSTSDTSPDERERLARMLRRAH